MVNVSEGRLRIAFKEADNSKKEEPEAAHFLKIDEQRLGRDLELYDLLTLVGGPEQSLADFVNVVLVLKEKLPKSYEVGSQMLKDLGLKVYPVDLQKNWLEIFN